MTLPRAALSRVAAALVLVAALAVISLVRLPAAFRGLNSAAAAASGKNELGGALVTADSADIDNNWVRAAFRVVPAHASFAFAFPGDLVQAEKTYHIDPLTFVAIPGMLEDLLLPRRALAAPRPGAYVLCYFCDSPYWDNRTRWLANDHAGGLVGYLYR
jgi:hypothetical protein